MACVLLADQDQLNEASEPLILNNAEEDGGKNADSQTEKLSDKPDTKAWTAVMQV